MQKEFIACELVAVFFFLAEYAILPSIFNKQYCIPLVVTYNWKVLNGIKTVSLHQYFTSVVNKKKYGKTLDVVYAM